MNHSSVLGIGSIAALLAVGAAGCTADAMGRSASTDPSGNATASTAAEPTQVLATLSLAGGRTVTFRQISADMLTIEEQGPVGQSPMASAIEGSILDVYRALSSGAEPPEALTNAEASRVVLARTAPAVIAAPPPAATVERLMPEKAAGLHPMGTGLDTWFQNTFCSDPHSTSCLIGNNQWLVTQWNQTPNPQAWGVNGGTVQSNLGLNIWNGSTWVQKTTTPLGAGRYNWLKSFTAGNSYWQAWQSPTGGDEAVDLWNDGAPTLSVDYAGQWIYTGSNFSSDHLVTITPMNPPPGAYGTGSAQATVTNGTFTVKAPVWCDSYSQTSTFSFRAVGFDTGQTVYATAQANYCWK